MFRWLWLLLTLLLTGCMHKNYDADWAEAPSYDGDNGGAMVMDEAAPMVASRSAKKSAPRGSSYARSAPPPSPASAPDAAEPAVPQAGPDRKVHYNGHATLRVSRTDQAADQVVAIATGAGGHLESLGARAVTVRVPVARFQEVFDHLLTLGQVIDKSISAEDITESIQATDLRLKSLRVTRDRLIELLAKAKDEKEKLQLVQQIQRVSEEIDRLESQARTLKGLADFSRITIELREREPLAWSGGDEPTAELRWIRRLSPFQPDVIHDSRPLRLTVPEGFVALQAHGPFVAESADGSRLWSGRLVHSPRGTADFWVQALQRRLASDFAKAEVQTVGDITFLRLVDRGDEPYTWLIGVRPAGRWLDVIEVFYPTAEQEQRYQDAVAAALTGGAA